MAVDRMWPKKRETNHRWSIALRKFTHYFSCALGALGGAEKGFVHN
jgi:hypothetical protein